MKYFLILLIGSVLSISVHSKPIFKLKITRIVTVRCNKTYVEARAWLTKPDRYTNAMNAQFSINYVPQSTKVKVKLYEFLSNEYRPFAINLERNLCSYMGLEYKAMLYPDYVKHGAHMPEPRCPIKPGNYSFSNLVPDIGNYPANVPFHNFMMELQYWHGTVEMLTMQFHGTLDRDAVIREQYG